MPHAEPETRSRLVRTVTGDVAPEALAKIDYHEHLFQISPLLPGDELDDERASSEEAASLVQSGFDAMIDATPIGLGRSPAATVRISAATGLAVIATTGVHHDGHYAPNHWLREWSAAQLVDALVTDVTEGLPPEDAPSRQPPLPGGRRAGVLKAGIGYWSISRFERRTLNAIGQAHAETGAPVMVHLEHGSAAFEVIDILIAGGVEPEATVLAHVDRNPDPYLHADLAATGAYLGYDGFARSKSWPDSVIVECAVRAASMGAARRILIGGDVARRSRYPAYGGMPGLAYLGRRGLPLIERIGGADLAHLVATENPRRFLARF
ncbi:aryldialkylphosphatase [Herbiconiux sp. CPCC 205763]|uniref:Aryldialkylphosphatase n=1 Tax=Herbiconiux aconitum TaxID=2970913 RepID=A0ABT2GQA3_9MICO|nr:aryldialkylphosphatase [Herbiconiux aconitum]MCS5716956.1 aryldialkylphosphatase [Herbiconiux aconitum]